MDPRSSALSTLVPQDVKVNKGDEETAASELWSAICRGASRFGKSGKLRGGLRAADVQISINAKLSQKRKDEQAAQAKAKANAKADAKIAANAKEACWKLKAPNAAQSSGEMNYNSFSSLLHGTKKLDEQQDAATRQDRRKQLPSKQPQRLRSHAREFRDCSKYTARSNFEVRIGHSLDKLMSVATARNPRPQAPTPCQGLSVDGESSVGTSLQWLANIERSPANVQSSFELPEYLKEFYEDQLAGNSFQEADDAGLLDLLPCGFNAGVARSAAAPHSSRPDAAKEASLDNQSHDGSRQTDMFGEPAESLLPPAHPVRKRPQPPTVPVAEMMPKGQPPDGTSWQDAPRLVSSSQVHYEYCVETHNVQQVALRPEFAGQVCWGKQGGDNPVVHLMRPPEDQNRDEQRHEKQDEQRDEQQDEQREEQRDSCRISEPPSCMGRQISDQSEARFSDDSLAYCLNAFGGSNQGFMTAADLRPEDRWDEKYEPELQWPPSPGRYSTMDFQNCLVELQGTRPPIGRRRPLLPGHSSPSPVPGHSAPSGLSGGGPASRRIGALVQHTSLNPRFAEAARRKKDALSTASPNSSASPAVMETAGMYEPVATDSFIFFCPVDSPTPSGRCVSSPTPRHTPMDTGAMYKTIARESPNAIAAAIDNAPHMRGERANRRSSQRSERAAQGIDTRAPTPSCQTPTPDIPKRGIIPDAGISHMFIQPKTKEEEARIVLQRRASDLRHAQLMPQDVSERKPALPAPITEEYSKPAPPSPRLQHHFAWRAASSTKGAEFHRSGLNKRKYGQQNASQPQPQQQLQPQIKPRDGSIGSNRSQGSSSPTPNNRHLRSVDSATPRGQYAPRVSSSPPRQERRASDPAPDCIDDTSGFLDVELDQINETPMQSTQSLPMPPVLSTQSLPLPPERLQSGLASPQPKEKPPDMSSQNLDDSPPWMSEASDDVISPANRCDPNGQTRRSDSKKMSQTSESGCMLQLAQAALTVAESQERRNSISGVVCISPVASVGARARRMSR